MFPAEKRPNWVLPQTRQRNVLLKSVIVAALLLILTRGVLVSLGLRFLGTDNIGFSPSPDVEVNTLPHGSTRSKIGKVLMQYGPENAVNERGIATHQAHNDNFGYSMSILRTQTMKLFWSKPAYVLKILLQELEKPSAERLEWLFWFDGDVVLMNPNIPLEIFLPPREKWSHIHLLVTQDHKGLNNGVYGLRVDPWSVWLMSSILSTPVARPGMRLRFQDQSAMEYWAQGDFYRKHTMHVPQRWFNAYAGKRGDGPLPDPMTPMSKFKANSIKEGDLLVHHSGNKDPVEGRPHKMEPWLDVAEQHLPEWELPLEKTTYAEEISMFWARDAWREKERVDKFRSQSNYTYV